MKTFIGLKMELREISKNDFLHKLICGLEKDHLM